MNPQEANDVNPSDDLKEDDLGIFIFSDSECIEIEQILRFSKYCCISFICLGICVITYMLASKKL